MVRHRRTICGLRDSRPLRNLCSSRASLGHRGRPSPRSHRTRSNPRCLRRPRCRACRNRVSFPLRHGCTWLLLRRVLGRYADSRIREGDSGRSRQRLEGESVLDRLVDDLTENAGASDDFSVRSVFRAISDDARANKQGMGLQAARDAATEAFGRLKATLPNHREASDPHSSPPGRTYRSQGGAAAKGGGKASRRP